VVVDGSIAELPGAAQYPHRVLVPAGAGEWSLVGRGHDRIVGRLPSDNDVLVDFIALPSSLTPGDRLVLLDAGAYDSSLAYLYGRGQTLDALSARAGQNARPTAAAGAPFPGGP
jgi:diaminopimelate decarboxylase